MHEDALLDQSSHFGLLEDAIHTAKDGVARIETSLVAVEAAIASPLETLSKGTVELERMQQCCELLRKVLRYVGLVRRLEKHLEQGQLAQAARCLVDLDGVIIEGAVAEVEKLRPVVEEHRLSLRAKASSLLTDGMQQQAQQDVTTALLAFATMDLLQEKVKTAVSIATNRVRRTVDEQDLEKKGVGELHDICLSVWHLQYVLVRVKEPSSGRPLWSYFTDVTTLTAPFWTQLAAKLSGSLVNQRDADYPRLYRILRDFCRKVMSSYEMMQLTPPHRLFEDSSLETLLKPLAPLSQAHVERTRRRFKKASDVLFKTSSSDRLCKVVTKELVLARHAPPILDDVCKEVFTLVRTVVEECVKRAEKNSTLLSVPTQTTTHQLNASMYNIALALEATLKSFALTVTQELEERFNPSIQHCTTAQRMILTPLGAVLKSVSAETLTAFRSSVLTLYRPSPAFQDVLGI